VSIVTNDYSGVRQSGMRGIVNALIRTCCLVMGGGPTGDDRPRIGITHPYQRVYVIIILLSQNDTIIITTIIIKV